mmetsp:Transcript_22679/g.51972  ORF Transcript_22679/g.51972 Transcript_22679/m.51972 type:complete len:207 (-) Transcript_22679:201-821(-)
MAHVPHRATGHAARGPNYEIVQGTVEGRQPQPCLGRKLQQPAEEVANHVAVTNDDFELVPCLVVGEGRVHRQIGVGVSVRGGRQGSVAEVVQDGGGGVATVEILVECYFRPFVVFVDSLYSGRAHSSSRDCMCRSSLVDIWISRSSTNGPLFALFYLSHCILTYTVLVLKCGRNAIVLKDFGNDVLCGSQCARMRVRMDGMGAALG